MLLAQKYDVQTPLGGAIATDGKGGVDLGAGDKVRLAPDNRPAGSYGLLIEVLEGNGAGRVFIVSKNALTNGTLSPSSDSTAPQDKNSNGRHDPSKHLSEVSSGGGGGHAQGQSPSVRVHDEARRFMRGEIDYKPRSIMNHDESVTELSHCRRHNKEICAAVEKHSSTYGLASTPGAKLDVMYLIKAIIQQESKHDVAAYRCENDELRTQGWYRKVWTKYESELSDKGLMSSRDGAPGTLGNLKTRARGFESSYGLMQVLYPMSYGDGLDSALDPESLYSPEKNIDVGVEALFKKMRSVKGDLAKGRLGNRFTLFQLTAGAYNGGLGALDTVKADKVNGDIDCHSNDGSAGRDQKYYLHVDALYKRYKGLCSFKSYEEACPSR